MLAANVKESLGRPFPMPESDARDTDARAWPPGPEARAATHAGDRHGSGRGGGVEGHLLPDDVDRGALRREGQATLLSWLGASMAA